jgi:hypothetical protein
MYTAFLTEGNTGIVKATGATREEAMKNAQAIVDREYEEATGHPVPEDVEAYVLVGRRIVLPLAGEDPTVDGFAWQPVGFVWRTPK